MRTRKYPWLVTTDCDMRWFPTFERAERWARHMVAESAQDRYAITANISGPGDSASVHLDGAGRVWTDLWSAL